MRTFAPAQSFLRVVDKFFCGFVLYDDELSAGPTLLYLYLFIRAGQRDHCCASQGELATVCKCSERSIQIYLQRLVELEYIRIEREGTRNVYHLLLSARVQQLIRNAEVDLAPEIQQNKNSAHDTIQRELHPGENFAPFNTQNPSCKGENSAPAILIRQKDSISPLSPLSTPNPTPRSLRRVAGGASLSAAPVKVERGETSPAPSARERNTAAEFEQLYAAWPRKQDRHQAARVYAALCRAGELPSLSTLLDVVARFKDADRGWRNGFAPNLRFWLSGRRWLDEPVTGFLARSSVAPAMQPATVYSSPGVVPAKEKLSDAREERPPVDTEYSRVADELCSLWKGAERGVVMAGLALANMRGFSFASVLAKARAEWSGGAECPPPVSDWFRHATA